MTCGHLPFPQSLSCSLTCAQTSLPGPGSSPTLLLQHPPNLLFKILSLEGEQEPAHVVLAQLIDAAGIDGTAQELVYLILGVQGVLSAPAEGRGIWLHQVHEHGHCKGKDRGSTQTECERVCGTCSHTTHLRSRRGGPLLPTTPSQVQMPSPLLLLSHPTYLSLLESSMP